MILFSILGIFLTVCLTYFAIKFSNLLKLIDIPNYRSSHANPTPKGGGIAIMVAFFLLVLSCLAIFYQASNLDLFPLLIATLCISLISLADDIKGISNKYRLLVQFFSALFLCVNGLTIQTLFIPFADPVGLGFLSVPVTIFWLVGMTNLYNFMDGIDGLAGGETFLVSLCLLILADITSNHYLQVVCWSLCLTSVGFLLFNFPPAKIFMGDTGSASIGFIFGALAIQGSQAAEEKVPFIVFIILLGTFIFDTTVTLILRIIRREKWFAAHRFHFYQRLLILNYSHFAVTVFDLIGTFILGGFALLYYFISNDLVRLILLLFLFVVSFLFAKAVTQMEESIDSFSAKKLKGVLDLIHSFGRHPKVSDSNGSRRNLKL